jgi:hypothetical protein
MINEPKGPTSALEERLRRDTGHMLLHGTRNTITEKILRPNRKGDLYATDRPILAIAKALVTNIAATLHYTLFDEPFLLVIEGDARSALCRCGHLYLVDREGFSQQPPGSTQWNSHTPTHVLDRIDVNWHDFDTEQYPLIDGTRSTRLRVIAGRNCTYQLVEEQMTPDEMLALFIQHRFPGYSPHK